MTQNQSPDREIRIGLLWHSLNSSNYGVGALTIGHMKILQEIGDERGCPLAFEIAGWSDPLPEYVKHPNTVFHGFNRRFMLGRDGLSAMARRCDLVFDIGGGDSFTDLYGSKRFWYQSLSKAVVLASGTPLILAPQTIGPFARGWTRRIAQMLMQRCQAVVSRDKLSSNFVRSMSSTIPLFEATDVAFRLPYERAEKRPSETLKVGINVSGLLFGGGYKGKNDYGLGVDYCALIRELIKKFTDDYQCDIHLFSHVIVPKQFDAVEDDFRIAEAIAAEFDGVIVEPVFASPSEVKSRISAMDFFFGSRMHACIAAFSAGVPTVPLAYSRKFLGLFDTLGYPLVADCINDTHETIVEKVTSGFHRRLELLENVRAANEEATRRIDLYKDLIRDQLGSKVQHAMRSDAA